MKSKYTVFAVLFFAILIGCSAGGSGTGSSGTSGDAGITREGAGS